ncbi:50S ribosomal protein L23 [Chlamydiifrater volucris]|uniref:50S ribosomal protein L23 n=1 Tax=Chlamydiifrater volucris TaxID=2681470 RepID=UPI001BCC355E|nr:50S ribosomal protein L23 [Chlamydiifrater volucris]
MSSPYDVIKGYYITEKAKVLESLSLGDGSGRKSGSYSADPKFVFLVAQDATKPSIAKALEQIYAEKNARVLKVNTICVKPKAKRVFRSRKKGKSAGFKKAIVTFQAGFSVA